MILKKLWPFGKNEIPVHYKGHHLSVPVHINKTFELRERFYRGSLYFHCTFFKVPTNREILRAAQLFRLFAENSGQEFIYCFTTNGKTSENTAKFLKFTPIKHFPNTKIWAIRVSEIKNMKFYKVLEKIDGERHRR